MSSPRDEHVVNPQSTVKSPHRLQRSQSSPDLRQLPSLAEDQRGSHGALAPFPQVQQNPSASESTALLPNVGNIQQPLLPQTQSRPSPWPRNIALATDLAAAVASAPLGGSGALGTSRGVVSGATWLGSAVASGIGNRVEGSNRSAFLPDVLGGTAGVLDAVSSGLNYGNTGPTGIGAAATAYGSNAAWALSAAASVYQGAASLYRRGWSGTAALQTLSGALNFVGAAAGGVAAYHSQNDDPDDPTASYYGFASAAAWTFGSLASIGSVYLARRAQSTQRGQDVEEV